MSSKSPSLLIVAYCVILFQVEVALAQPFSAQEFPYPDERPLSAGAPSANHSELQLAWQRYELEHAAHVEATRVAKGYKQRSMRVGLTMMIMGFPVSFAAAFLSLLEVSAGHGDINYTFVHTLLITSAVGLAAGATGAGLLLHRSLTNPHVQARIDARDRAREAKREYEQIRRARRGTSALHLTPTLRLQGRATVVGAAIALEHVVSLPACRGGLRQKRDLDGDAGAHGRRDHAATLSVLFAPFASQRLRGIGTHANRHG